MTDSDGSGADSLESSRVSSEPPPGVSMTNVQGEVERALAALTAGRLDVAQTVLRSLLTQLKGT